MDPTTPTTEDIQSRKRTNTTTSIVQSVGQSVVNTAGNILSSDPPSGFFAATASAAASTPTLTEIRRGSFGHDGWRSEASSERRRRTNSSSASSRRPAAERKASGGGPTAVQAPATDVIHEHDEHGMVEPFPALTEEPRSIEEPREETESPATKSKADIEIEEPELSVASREERELPPSKLGKTYTGGYIPPPVVPWTQSTVIGLKAFGKWLLTPFGFLVTLYGCNVVAWGGMLFLLLCNASPVMCWSPVPNDQTNGRHSLAASLALKRTNPWYFNCNDLNSPRRIWLEIDSQILNALFCVTGFGLVPWRFRDLYYLLKWRFTSERSAGYEKKMYGLRVLAGIHKDWFRLPGSDTRDEMTAQEYYQSIGKSNSNTAIGASDIEAGVYDHDVRVPLPLAKTPSDPLTGVRAPPTALWKLDFFIWCQCWNTFFQICLCGFMWGLDRYDRPSWATGLFIGLACVIAGIAGFMSFLEGKGIKRCEGVMAPHVQAAAAETFDLELVRPDEKSKQENVKAVKANNN